MRQKIKQWKIFSIISNELPRSYWSMLSIHIMHLYANDRFLLNSMVLMCDILLSFSFIFSYQTVVDDKLMIFVFFFFFFLANLFLNYKNSYFLGFFLILTRSVEVPARVAFTNLKLLARLVTSLEIHLFFFWLYYIILV